MSPFAPQLDEVNTVTQKKILPGVADNYFKSGPTVAYLKKRYNRKWNGPQIQENFLYDTPRGGAYAPGGVFNLTRKQTKTGLLFAPKYYHVNVTEYLEMLEVELAGDMAVYSTVRQDLAEAALAMSAILEVAMFHHGQNLGAGANNRILEINGLEEPMTNSTDATWTGVVIPTYGGQARSGVGTALDSPTSIITTPSNTVMSYRLLMGSYFSCQIGNETPKLGITTNAGMLYIAENFLAHQLVSMKDPEIGWRGLQFNDATILASQYCPGQYGVNDPILGNYFTGASAGETFWWLNPGPQGDDAYIRLWIAASPKFAMGFTGFKGARDDNMVAGQLLFAGNLTNRTPRLHRALYGITR